MPKKTTYSRNTAQRGKAKQKSFELVRPVSDDDVLETVESSEETESAEVDTIEPDMEETPAQETKGKRPSARVSSPIPVAAAATVASSAPKSASARIAARRQAAQKPQQQRSAASMVMAENYSYVRKDLLFILILAIIMFSIIIALHFVIGS